MKEPIPIPIPIPSWQSTPREIEGALPALVARPAIHLTHVLGGRFARGRYLFVEIMVGR